jgi:hypothetical protein
VRWRGPLPLHTLPFNGIREGRGREGIGGKALSTTLSLKNQTMLRAFFNFGLAGSQNQKNKELSVIF